MPGAPSACLRALVTGRVQGVGFRYHTHARARALAVRGWVRNLPDGRVEVWMEGEPAAVEALVSWLRTGPVGARVEGVETRGEDAAGHPTFSIQ